MYDQAGFVDTLILVHQSGDWNPTSIDTDIIQTLHTRFIDIPQHDEFSGRSHNTNRQLIVTYNTWSRGFTGVVHAQNQLETTYTHRR